MVFRFSVKATASGAKERIGAGEYGTCSWVVHSKKLGDFLDDTGFPSSKKKDLIIEKARLFFPKDMPNRSIKFIIYSLGYIEADGCIEWMYAHDTWPPEIELNRIAFIARDRTFLEWMASEFVELGMKPSVLQNTPSVSVLHLSHTDDTAMKLFKEALDAIKMAKVPIAGKLQFLQDLFTHKSLPEHHVAPRQQSFLDYLGENHDDPIIRVLAQ